MPRQSINQMLAATELQRALFLGNAVIPKGTTSKPRRSEKRQAVINIEMKFLRENLDINRFPLVRR